MFHTTTTPLSLRFAVALFIASLLLLGHSQSAWQPRTLAQESDAEEPGSSPVEHESEKEEEIEDIETGDVQPLAVNDEITHWLQSIMEAAGWFQDSKVQVAQCVISVRRATPTSNPITNGPNYLLSSDTDESMAQE